MTRTIASRLFLGALLPVMVLGGCWGSSEEAKPAAEMAAPEGNAEVEALAELAKKIKANPDDLDQILSDAGMTAEQLQDKLYAIAEDPKASVQYLKALQGGGAE